MCGIAGLLNPVGGRDHAALAGLCRAMAERLKHRGPDVGGEWTDAGAGIGFGHRRLSIIDLSPNGRQPMLSSSGRFVVNYNGEIYNFAQLRRLLEERGVRFRGQGDTEVLTEAVDAWGVEDALRLANGMFALAVWDRLERTLWLARDRMGQKPLYYGWANGAFIFASELKAFEAIPGVERNLDRNALSLFLRHGCVPAPWSIWKEFRKLTPGHLLKVTAADVTTRRWPQSVVYWSLREVMEAGAAQPILHDEEAADALEALLGDAVKLCAVADVPLGAFLSGGVDSSSVVALMQAVGSRPVRSFTIGFREDRYDEAAQARAVARHLGTEHTELYVEETDARAVIPLLPGIYDEPFADSSQIPTYLVSSLARQSVTVSLSGDGGDELFGGYNRHVWGERLAGGIDRVPHALRGAVSGIIRAVPPGAWDTVVGLLPRRVRPPQAGDKIHKLAHAMGAASYNAAYLELISFWREPDVVVRGGSEPASRGISVKDRFAEQMMLIDSETYLPDDVLTKLDRASMAVSLEARAPLLDHRIVEFAWRLPLSMRVRDGRGKWLLRKVLGRYVPRALTERPKTGFAVPIDSWLRGPLRDWAETLLNEARLREEGFFDPAPIRRCWNDHLSGRRNRQHAIWAVLMFQAWAERQGKLV